jgi:OOP family OmpA-OmpF porin
MKLSKARANAVRDYLASKDVPSYKMLTTGMGETMPIASNDTKEGRAANRRVQVLILGRTKETE